MDKVFPPRIETKIPHCRIRAPWSSKVLGGTQTVTEQTQMGDICGVNMRRLPTESTGNPLEDFTTL